MDPNNLTSIGGLIAEGFGGFPTVADLRSGKWDQIPNEPGVYQFIFSCECPPGYLTMGTGGRFKGNDANVSIAKLEDEWVQGALIVYVGQTKRNLRKRIRTMIRFGLGFPTAHRGGRLMWQLDGAERLQVCWKVIRDQQPRRVERALIKAFRASHAGKRPFANLRD